MQLVLGKKTYELELNFGRIQEAQRKLGLTVWPPGADYEAKPGTAPNEFIFRVFVAAARLKNLDEAFAAVTSEDELQQLAEAICKLLEEYQPEKFQAFVKLLTAINESQTSPPISGSADGPLLESTSASPALSSKPVQSANGRGLPTSGKRVKRHETTRLRV